MLDDRARLLLHTLVERYIADGQPVGSRTLSRASGLELSPATIRNVMADLEEAGLITSPHTSAGRVPTSRGYRLFVDTMLTAEPALRGLGNGAAEGQDNPLALALTQAAREQLQPDQPQRVIANAAQVLSSLSSFVGVVLAPKQRSVFRHIEFLRLSDRRLLVIIVSPEGDVQNRIIFTDYPYTASQLVEAANYLNENFAGQDLEAVRSRLQHEVEALQGEIASLMQAAVNLGTEAMSRPDDTVIVSGERNLLGVQDFSNDMGNLRRLFDVFEQKAQLIRLLDVSHKADGVRIYIGGESDLVPAQELSVVSAPYEVDGKVVGTLGVVGPTRMAYDRMIRIVDITAKMVGTALSQR